jgi:hypothetical protein
VDGSERGGPRLPRTRGRAPPREPARPNRRRVRALSPFAPPTRSRLPATGRANARWICHFASTTSMRNGCCQFWFEKQPKGRSPGGTRRSTCARAEASWWPRVWSVRANGHHNSHCAPTGAFILRAGVCQPLRLDRTIGHEPEARLAFGGKLLA